MLFSRRPAEELDGRTVLVSRSSHDQRRTCSSCSSRTCGRRRRIRRRRRRERPTWRRWSDAHDRATRDRRCRAACLAPARSHSPYRARVRPRRRVEAVDRTAVRVRRVGARSAPRMRSRRWPCTRALIESRNWGLAHLDLLAASRRTQTTGVRAAVRASTSAASTTACRYAHLGGLTEFFGRLAARRPCARRLAHLSPGRLMPDRSRDSARSSTRTRRCWNSAPRPIACASALHPRRHRHVHRRPQHQLHERVRRRLRLLCVLPSAEARRGLRRCRTSRSARRSTRQGARWRADPDAGRAQSVHPVRVVSRPAALHQAAPPDPHPRLQPERSGLLLATLYRMRCARRHSRTARRRASTRFPAVVARSSCSAFATTWRRRRPAQTAGSRSWRSRTGRA